MSPLLTLLLGIAIGLLVFLVIFKLKFGKYSKVVPQYNEADAEGLLKRNGYKIIKKQKTAPLVLFVDGKSHLITVAADYIVEKSGKKFVVKVLAETDVDFTDPMVLRKLLELKIIFKSYQLLFLDLHAGIIRDIKFEFPKEETEILFTVFIAMLIILVIVGIIALMVQVKLF